MKKFSLLHVSVLALVCVGIGAPRAAAQTVINSLPYTITTSGRYVLGGNLSSPTTTAADIAIKASNVVLDLNGHFLAGPGDTTEEAGTYNCVIGIYAVANVVVKNGTVSGRNTGIYCDGDISDDGARNIIIESVVVTRCTLIGILFDSEGSLPGSVVRNCTFTNLGGVTYGSGNYAAIGITTVEDGIRIENNTFGAITGTGTGGSYGIYDDSASGGNFMIGNTISGCTVGIERGKCLNNLTYNCTTPFSGTTNVTGNN